MPEFLRWVLGAFACYRLAQLLAIDDGPFQVFSRLREWAGCYDYGEDGRPRRSVGRLLACPYCLGLWFAVLCAVCCLWPRNGTDLALAVFGIAGAQAWLQGGRDVSDG